MAVELQPIPLAEKAALKAMLDPCLIEHADLVDPRRVHGDPRSYDYFDPYWVDPDRHPYWIMADGERVGFCLVNAHPPSGQTVDHAVAEFSVLAAHRCGGLGRAAVRAVLPAIRASGSCRSTTPIPAAWPSGPGPWPPRGSAPARCCSARTG